MRGFVVDDGRGDAPPEPPEEPARAPVEVPRGTISRLTQELRQSIQSRGSGNQSERMVLRKAFADIDTDRSGLIDINEFCRALERFGLHTAQHGLRGGVGGLGKEVVEALFKSFDRDGSGYLDYPEFEEALLQPERPAPPPAIRSKPRIRGAGMGYA